MIEFKQETCGHLDAASRREWLETNGLGGFASSTIAGLNTRRYHGLLVAATKPPVGRLVMLSKLEETLFIDGRGFELSTNRYPGVVHPLGFRYLKQFRLDPFITAHVKVNGNTEAARRQAAEWLIPLKQHLADAGLGHISEVLDGDAPHRPGGCIAQAWSVGEILRAYVEDVKGIRPATPLEGQATKTPARIEEGVTAGKAAPVQEII